MYHGCEKRRRHSVAPYDGAYLHDARTRPQLPVPCDGVGSETERATVHSSQYACMHAETHKPIRVQLELFDPIKLD